MEMCKNCQNLKRYLERKKENLRDEHKIAKSRSVACARRIVLSKLDLIREILFELEEGDNY